MTREEQRRRSQNIMQWLTAGCFAGCFILALCASCQPQVAAVEELPAEPVAAVAEPVDAVQEDFENGKIEAALLAKAHRIDDCTVTHYCTCAKCCGKNDGITASGLQATPGVTVGVDPSVIPLGSDVLVDYGDGEIHYYRADDTGVTGNHIDLCVADHQTALNMGVRTATVYWIGGD